MASLALIDVDKEQRNFFGLIILLHNVGNKRLRKYFKTQWLVVYKNLKGTSPPPWADVPNDATEMNKIERNLNIRKNEKLKFDNGDTKSWDFSLLSTVLLHSSLGFITRPSKEEKALKYLKDVRNDLVGHNASCKIDDATFKSAWSTICNALTLFGASQTDFDSVEDVIKKPSDTLVQLLKECVAKEEDIKHILSQFLEKVEKSKKQVLDKMSQHCEELKETVKEDGQLTRSQMKEGSRNQPSRYIRMVDDQRLRLVKYLPHFQDHVIATNLLQNLPCLTDKQKDEIACAERSYMSSTVVRILVEKLEEYEEGFHQFVQALRKAGLGHLAVLLDADFESHKSDNDTKEDDEAKFYSVVGETVDVMIPVNIFEENNTRRRDLEKKIASAFNISSSPDSKTLRQDFHKVLPNGVYFVHTTKQLGSNDNTREANNTTSSLRTSKKDCVLFVFRVAKVSVVDELWKSYQEKNLEKSLHQVLSSNKSISCNSSLEMSFQEKDYVAIKHILEATKWDTFKVLPVKAVLIVKEVEHHMAESKFRDLYNTNPQGIKIRLPFLNDDTQLLEVLDGSVIFVLDFPNISSLKRLWKSYKDGSLALNLKKALNEIKELNEQTNGEEIDVEITIDGEEYREVYRNLILLEVKGSSLKNVEKRPVHSKFQMREAQRLLLEQRLPHFQDDVIATDLLDNLPCLTDQQKDQIEYDEKNYLPSKAVRTLVDKLKEHKEGFHQFVEALHNAHLGHVPLLLEENFADIPIIIRTKRHRERHTDLERAIASKFSNSSMDEAKELRQDFEKVLPKGIYFVHTKLVEDTTLKHQEDETSASKDLPQERSDSLAVICRQNKLEELCETYNYRRSDEIFQQVLMPEEKEPIEAFVLANYYESSKSSIKGIMAFTEEELNYFRLCNIVTRIIPEGLREIFKQEWDALYTGSQYGPWNDTPANYVSFEAMESATNLRHNKRLLIEMNTGDRKDWDSTCLFYAIMLSDSVGSKLPPIVEKGVDDLRESRNEIAHSSDRRLTEADFQTSIKKILEACKALKLDTTRVKEIKNQTNFPTKEFNSIKLELNSIKQELENENKRNAEPTSFCVLPPKPCHDNIVRTHEVERTYEEMKQLLNEKKGRETTVLYLSGNPGCGKSVLARQIAEKYFVPDETAVPTFVMTINACNIDTLLQSYVEFTGRLNCYPDSITQIITSKDLSKENQILQLKALAFKQADRYSSWLIIIDNVTDLKSLSKYWTKSEEKTSGIGQILVTTQDTHSIALSSHTKHISLKNGMTEKDSIQVLCKVSSLKEDDKMMLKVAKTLDYQPLALACAGVYMHRVCTRNKLFTWKQYLQRLEEGKHEATERPYEETSLNYPLTMTVAVQLALQKEIRKNQIMLHTFDFLSVIAKKPIPLEYVVQFVVKCMPDEDENLVAPSIVSSSLVISSHEDVQEITLNQVVYHCLQNNKRNITSINTFRVITAFQRLESILSDECLDSLKKTRPLVDHFVAIADRLKTSIGMAPIGENYNNIAESLSLIGIICHNHSHYNTAKIYYENALAIQKIAYGENHPSVAITLDNLGSTLCNMGEYEKAKAYYENALAIKKTAYGENYPSVGATLNNLGNILQQMGEYGKAKTYYKNALAIQKTAYGENNPSMGATLYNLGSTLCKTGKYEKAKTYYENALAIQKTAYGENNPSMGATLNNLGSTLCKTGEYEKAKTYYENALAIQKTAYGENHPSVGSTLNNLGGTLYNMGEYEKAKTYYENALAIKKTAYGENHPSVGATLNNLGSTLCNMGEYEKAKTYYENSLAIQKTAYGENHPSMGATLNILGNILQEMGEYEKAKTYYENALAIQKTAYGENPLSVGATLNNLGSILYNMREYKKAKTYYENALAIQKTAYGENHPSVAGTLDDLGSTLCNMGQYEKAKAYYENALAIKKTAYGENNPSMGATLNNIGITLCKTGKYEKAKTYYENALAIQKTAYGENHPSVGATLNNLGGTLYNMEEYEKAKTYYEKALAIKKTAYGENHPSVGATLNNLGNVLQEMGEYEKSKPCYENALAIK